MMHCDGVAQYGEFTLGQVLQRQSGVTFCNGKVEQSGVVTGVAKAKWGYAL